MKTLEDQLSQYAAYHRDHRNIVTHFIGIPMIVVGAAAMLSRPATEFAGVPVSLATVVGVALGVFYLRLDLALGLLMSLLLAGALAIGATAAAGSTTLWLTTGIGLLVVGWIFQFVGHAWEGRKPAFIDDVIGLAIGPLFVVAEALFGVGAMPKLRATVAARAEALRRGLGDGTTPHHA